MSHVNAHHSKWDDTRIDSIVNNAHPWHVDVSDGFAFLAYDNSRIILLQALVIADLGALSGFAIDNGCFLNCCIVTKTAG